MSAALEKIETLRPDFEYTNEETGKVVMTVGFVASFYFWGGHTKAKRLALAECFDAYREAYGDNLTWARNPDTWKPIMLSKKPLPVFRDYILLLDEDDGIQWYESSGDGPDEAGEYSLGCLTERGWQEGYISCFQFQVPRSHAFDGEKLKTLEALIALCVERLTPFHGVAGLTQITTELALTWEPEALDLATRYRALFIDDIVTDRSQAPKGLKGVNWFTFVSDLLTERVGGPQAFVAYCRRFGVTPILLANGYTIRAGETPQLGPIDEAPPDAYVHANRAIRPLRNGKFGSMGSGSIHGEQRFTRCTSDLWIRRFDGPELASTIWPPASFAGLPPGPIGKPPTKKIKLDTGTPCVVHGRYRKLPIDPALFDEDEDEDEEYDRSPMVVLLPGDFAPFYLVLGPHGEFLRRDAVVWELAAEL
ncbi:MAG: type VI immunity family protein [Pseudomonadota bacterium]